MFFRTLSRGFFARAMLIRKAAIAALNSEAISVLPNFVSGLFRPSDAYQKSRYCSLEPRGDFEATESQHAAQRRSTENAIFTRSKLMDKLSA